MTKITVLGSGAWGTTLAIQLANKGITVNLWEYQTERATVLQSQRENTVFLPGFRFPETLTVVSNPAEALSNTNLVLLVLPTQRVRTNLKILAPFIPDDALIISASKGIEVTSLQRITQICEEELQNTIHHRLGVISGPNLAHEIAEGKPAASVVAMFDHAAAAQAQTMLSTPTLRIYSSDDVIGVELGGALKNIIAIAIGATDGLSFGDNTKATLMTRGIAEMARLAIAEGANPMTVAGLAGLGDLIATCSSSLSRNYTLGRELTTTGRSLDEILRTRHSVTEGVMTAYAALELANRHKIPMPITESLCKLFGGLNARDLVSALMQRDLRPERDL